MHLNFVEYSTVPVEISGVPTKIFEFSKVCRLLFHFESCKNIENSLIQSIILNFFNVTYHNIGANSNFLPSIFSFFRLKFFDADEPSVQSSKIFCVCRMATKFCVAQIHYQSEVPSKYEVHSMMRGFRICCRKKSSKITKKLGLSAV